MQESCDKVHNLLNETTNKETMLVVDKMNNSKLKISYEKKLISVTGFKNVGVAFK